MSEIETNLKHRPCPIQIRCLFLPLYHFPCICSSYTTSLFGGFYTFVPFIEDSFALAFTSSLESLQITRSHGEVVLLSEKPVISLI